LQAKAQNIRKYEKTIPSSVRISCLRRTIKNLQKLGHEVHRDQRSSIYGRKSDFLEITMGIRRTAK